MNCPCSGPICIIAIGSFDVSARSSARIAGSRTELAIM